MVHNSDSNKNIELADAQATDLFADRLAQACRKVNAMQPGLVIYLNGDLGSGKTSLARRFIQNFLVDARVKSPTYTLVESYPTNDGVIHHFDLYRLCEPEELEYLGVRDLLIVPFIALVEWPDKGEGVMPKADLNLNWQFLRPGRSLQIQPQTEAGQKVFEALMK